jgi:hypothetical protein
MKHTSPSDEPNVIILLPESWDAIVANTSGALEARYVATAAVIVDGYYTPCYTYINIRVAFHFSLSLYIYKQVCQSF